MSRVGVIALSTLVVLLAMLVAEHYIETDRSPIIEKALNSLRCEDLRAFLPTLPLSQRYDVLEQLLARHKESDKCIRCLDAVLEFGDFFPSVSDAGAEQGNGLEEMQEEVVVASEGQTDDSVVASRRRRGRYPLNPKERFAHQQQRIRFLHFAANRSHFLALERFLARWDAALLVEEPSSTSGDDAPSSRGVGGGGAATKKPQQLRTHQLIGIPESIQRQMPRSLQQRLTFIPRDPQNVFLDPLYGELPPEGATVLNPAAFSNAVDFLRFYVFGPPFSTWQWYLVGVLVMLQSGLMVGTVRSLRHTAQVADL